MYVLLSFPNRFRYVRKNRENAAATSVVTVIKRITIATKLIDRMKIFFFDKVGNYIFAV